MKRAAAPILALTLVLMVLAIWPDLERPGKTIREALLLFAGPLIAALSLREMRARPPRAFLVLVGLAALSTLLAVLPAPQPEFAAVLREFALLAALWSVAIAVCLQPFPEGTSHGTDVWLETAVLASLVLLGLIGAAQAWWGWEGLPQFRSPAGTLVNRNVAAQVLVVLLPLAVPALLSGDARRRWAGGLACGLGGALLIATRARGAWLGLALGGAVGVAVWLIGTRGRSRPTRESWVSGPAALCAALILLALLLPVRGADPLPSVAERIGSLVKAGEGTGETRLAFWRNTLAMTEARPLLGVGPGRFPVEYPRFQSARVPTPFFGVWRQPEHPHNDLLEVAAESGWPSALVLGLLLLGALASGLRQTRDAESGIDAARAAARCAALAGVMVHGLVSFPLHSPASAFIVWVLVGRCWARRETSAGGALARGLAVVCLAGALMGGWVGLAEIRGQAALGEAMRAHVAGSCKAALDAARQVTRSAPWRRREVGMAAMLHFECDNDPVRSLKVLEPALKMQPNNLNLLLAVGARCLKAGRVSDAESLFVHSAEIGPGEGRAWLGLAMARDALGDREGASIACGRAVEVAPAFREARLFCQGNRYVGP